MTTMAVEQALDRIAGAGYLMTARGNGRVGRATVRWVTQASAEPPLLVAALPKRGQLFACLVEGGSALLHLDPSGAAGNGEARLDCRLERIVYLDSDHVVVVLQVADAC